MQKMCIRDRCSYWRGEQNESKKKNITATGQHCLADCGVQYYSNWNTQLYRACDSCEYFALSADVYKRQVPEQIVPESERVKTIYESKKRE